MSALAALACLATGPLAAAPETPLAEAAAHPLAGRIVDVAAGNFVAGPAAFVAALSKADVVFLGEVHDNPEHHAAQARATAALAPAGLAFEMIRPEDEAALARLRAEGAGETEIAAALEWEARGWPDFALYAPILAAAPEAVVTGAEVPHEALTRAMRESAAAGFGAAAARFGLDAALDPAAEAAATAEQVAAHCGAISEEVARGMVEAQRLRDAAIAEAALRARALSEEPGPVIVIAGAGHARRGGAPAALAAARPDLAVRTVAFVEVEPGREDWRDYAERAETGFLWFTAPAPREDPCAVFRQREAE